MRFMMLIIPNGYQKAEPGTLPDTSRIREMLKYNQSLQKAGVLLTLDALEPPSMGARVTFAAGKPRVEHGPFRGAAETLGGYWIIEVKSKEEAIEWALRCPASAGDIIEVRPMQELGEFPEDIQTEEAALAERLRGRSN